MKRSVLVTGFEPFGGAKTNPSADLVAALQGQTIRGRVIASATLPVEFGTSRRMLARALREVQPELVICFGLAGNRTAFSLERIAVNIDDARIPDNAGQQPVDTPILQRGPAAYWSTLPVKAMAKALRDADIPAEVSQTAGTYVCNHVFYGLMSLLRRRPGVRGGFIHVPLPRAAFDLPRMIRAAEIVIDTALRTKRDLRVPGGAVS
ncbi:pyroglutamyl-peptidase I [Synoicihabitans lomoniglobus]|uniref:Pyroglutamyl-peptidase I n=1 Tax=Synoicihabitans lomoniglobus TaxID=2909285 RepID=A0AAF0CRG9_9BACT|nr:pyroglutamyl-peptidase I [Opitutaceae bacterium LMO-M01]WED66729.1 pyroglutamyl-peptidase I [Opitutaceae bacterium LMO-M01]